MVCVRGEAIVAKGLQPDSMKVTPAVVVESHGLANEPLSGDRLANDSMHRPVRFLAIHALVAVSSYL